MKKTKIILFSLCMLVVVSGQVLAYPDIYLDQIGADFDFSPSSDSEMNYLPLEPIAEYYHISLSYDRNDKEVRGRYGKEYFTLKFGSQVAEIRGKRTILDAPVLLVNGHTLVPRDFIESLLRVDFKWRPTAPEIIFKERSFQDSVNVQMYMNKDQYRFGDQIVVTLVVKNTSNSRVSAPMRSSQLYDLSLSFKGTEIWRWSRGKMFTSAVNNYVLDPGETKIYNITLPQELILTPAQYQLIGTLETNPEIQSNMYYLNIK